MDEEDFEMQTSDKAMDISTSSATASSSSDGDYEDRRMMPGSAHVNRYWLDQETAGPTCFNCGERGHVNRECKQANQQPCYLCAEVGHGRSDCPQEICFNCHRPGHHSRDCREARRRRVREDELCNHCQQPGHLRLDCPVRWRRYRLRKTSWKPNNKAAWCCYCAANGHWGDDCPARERPVHSIYHRFNHQLVKLMALEPTLDEGKREQRSERSERGGRSGQKSEGRFDSRSKELDLRSKEHDLRSKERDSRNKDYDSRGKGRDSYLPSRNERQDTHRNNDAPSRNSYEGRDVKSNTSNRNATRNESQGRNDTRRNDFSSRIVKNEPIEHSRRNEPSNANNWNQDSVTGGQRQVRRIVQEESFVIRRDEQEVKVMKKPASPQKHRPAYTGGYKRNK